MESETLAALIDKYFSGKASPSERAALEEWYKDRVGGEIEWMAEDYEEKQLLKSTLFRAIQQETNVSAVPEDMQPAAASEVKKRRPGLWLKIAAAAVILIAIGLTVYQKQMQGIQLSNREVAFNTADRQDTIVPGTNGAVLTLANGKKVVLDNASVGSAFSSEGGTAVSKAGDSLLVYNGGNEAGSKTNIPLRYNTLETPRGRQFSVMLPDGSRVWLNAASSLKYPTAFTGKERIVELTGEAFFEVAHNERKPFKVKTNGQLIEDIGTRFNVNAYSDEKGVRTTLLEGAVQVRATGGAKSYLLHPGQEAVNEGQKVRIRTANLKKVMSWKNGYFEFEHEDIRTVLRQIARWYNVEVVYQGDEPDSYFTGDIDRQASIQQVLEVLSFTGVHFKISGHTITVIH